MKFCRTSKCSESGSNMRESMNLKQLQKLTHYSIATQQSIPRRQYASLFSMPVDVRRSLMYKSNIECSFNLEDQNQKISSTHCKHCIVNQSHKYQSTWKRASLIEIREKSQLFVRNNLNSNSNEFQTNDDCTCCEKNNCDNKVNGMQLRQFIMRYNLYKEQCEFLRQKFSQFIEKEQQRKIQQENKGQF